MRGYPKLNCSETDNGIAFHQIKTVHEFDFDNIKSIAVDTNRQIGLSKQGKANHMTLVSNICYDRFEFCLSRGNKHYDNYVTIMEFMNAFIFDIIIVDNLYIFDFGLIWVTMKKSNSTSKRQTRA